LINEKELLDVNPLLDFAYHNEIYRLTL